jgi:hypothetical protein
MNTVREAPPLRVTHEITTPSGKRYRWAADERDPENVPSQARWSDVMPGGFENADITLPRLPGIDYDDLERLSTLRVLDAGCGIVGEYRLERAPATTGDQSAISPGLVGWQAALDDNEAFNALYVNRDPGFFGDPPLERQAVIADNGRPNGDTISRDGLTWTLPEDVPPRSLTETWTPPRKPLLIAAVEYVGSRKGDFTGLEGPYIFRSGDLAGGILMTLDGTLQHADLAAPDPAVVLHVVNASTTVTVNPPDVSGFPAGVRPQQIIDQIAVYGDTGIPTWPTRDNEPYGVLASDVIRHAVTHGAFPLRVTSDTIVATGFVIPHLPVFTTGKVSDIISQAARFELNDWAVWENLLFYLHPRGARGRTWRARIGPAQLNNTGPQVQRLWESVVVSFTDPGDGQTYTVGPPGSGCDVESPDLKDPDPLNPANEYPTVRRALLQGGTLTPESAIQVGGIYLQEQKKLDSSGNAQFVGTVEDDRGIIHPYHHVRAGDQVIFLDAADTSPRRIIRADKDDRTKTCSVDLDAPPDAMQALLERLGVALVPIGLS